MPAGGQRSKRTGAQGERSSQAQLCLASRGTKGLFPRHCCSPGLVGTSGLASEEGQSSGLHRDLRGGQAAATLGTSSASSSSLSLGSLATFSRWGTRCPSWGTPWKAIQAGRATLRRTWRDAQRVCGPRPLLGPRPCPFLCTPRAAARLPQGSRAGEAGQDTHTPQPWTQHDVTPRREAQPCLAPISPPRLPASGQHPQRQVAARPAGHPAAPLASRP